MTIEYNTQLDTALEDAPPNDATNSMRWVVKVCVISGVISVLVTIAFFGWWAMKDKIVFGHEKFDQVAWISANDETLKTCKRGDMAYDLQQRLLQPGMPLDQVTILLGRPTWDDGTQIEYDLGNCMHVIHGIRLFFDEQQRLTHSRIVQH